MIQNSDIPDTPTPYPRFMVAVANKVVTLPSPKDGQHGLAVFWTEAAAKRVARKTPGEAVIVEATPEMFVEALNKAHQMGVPWMYIGDELAALSVIFHRNQRGPSA